MIAGALKLGSVSPQDGTQRLTLYVEPYHWFGEVSLIDRMPRAMLAVADTPSTVLVTSRARCCSHDASSVLAMRSRFMRPFRIEVCATDTVALRKHIHSSGRCKRVR